MTPAQNTPPMTELDLLGRAFHSFLRKTSRMMAASVAKINSKNNEGIKLLRSGDYETALARFNESLVLTRCLLEPNPRNCKPTGYGSFSRIRSPANPLTSTHVNDSRPLINIYGVTVVKVEDDDCSPGNIFTFYNRAFVFRVRDPHTLSANTVPIQLKRDISACIVYNVAFACHLAGLCTERSQIGQRATRDELQRALSIYMMLDRLLPSDVRSVQEMKETGACVLIVRLAMLTNLGHIQSHNCRRDEALESREKLRELFAEISMKAPYAITKEEYGFFCFNVIFSFSIDMKVASAA